MKLFPWRPLQYFFFRTLNLSAMKQGLEEGYGKHTALKRGRGEDRLSESEGVLCD